MIVTRTFGIFAAVFAVVYTLAFEFHWELFSYHPREGRFGWFQQASIAGGPARREGDQQLPDAVRIGPGRLGSGRNHRALLLFQSHLFRDDFRDHRSRGFPGQVGLEHGVLGPQGRNQE